MRGEDGGRSRAWRQIQKELTGSGKRFGVFGKRAERGFTKSLNLSPGVRVVRVRVRSAADKFDHTRTERFDLDSASVAALQVTADKSGLSVVADRPLAPERLPASEPTQVAQATKMQAVGVTPSCSLPKHSGTTWRHRSASWNSRPGTDE